MQKQRGASLYTMSVFLVLFLFAVTFAVKVVPFYVDDATIKSVLREVAQKAAAENMGRGDIEDSIYKHLLVNNLTDYAKEIEIDNKGSTDRLIMNYERRSHLISNIDIVASFQHDVEITSE
ncbi:MAG: DUF4845 domain-containing protein [Oceanospirillaceae bacterium]|nr:DUF4845 domain-containing protein [Oceanospirillaceae bacterium]